ncbi:MAG: phosphoheptose isomerase [Bacteroidetes bacterium GWF2_33_38]|nr:MAG: phosphoheptose isomerase [Bacteroidetes bacterium GWF2_33_38]OFY76153.1 MAG: phosphoheptose isomerase [Bacteroidetes bacterium RIFOXYA12_FULL_33_9]OFY91706.1 MAG: phosphoheptose isomerase [Bacteroidetes bacterium RIFOXYA2_FULL_33_7]
MAINIVKNNFKEAQRLLEEFINDPKSWGSIEKAGGELVKAFQQGNKVIACGNGGSMADAIHFCEELTSNFRRKRKGLPAIAVSDPGYLSCASNDFGFENVFSRYVDTLGQKGDILFAISTSGNSENILRAVNQAKQKGMKVVALTGKGGGKLSTLCDFEVRAPYSDYSDRTQEIHIKIIHSLIHYIELSMKL